MSTVEERLKAMDALLKKGVAPAPETVRAFLSWFGAARRGWRVVRQIRRQLEAHNLTTNPDFEYAYIDGQISFVRAEAPKSQEAPATDLGEADPTYRISRLEAANRTPVSVAPDNTLQQAITVMLANDFSLLPVMVGTRNLKGVISWKSIGSRLALKRPCAKVHDCMEPAQIVSSSESLFSALVTIGLHDYVLVESKTREICGIVTASDINGQFRLLAEPFLLIGEIENGVRQILRGKFTAAELNDAKAPGEDGRAIEAVADLTFGEYIRLVEPEKRWKKLKLEVDRVKFLEGLNRVRDVRNDVMHFDPEGLEPGDFKFLQDFAAFLRSLRDIGAIQHG